MSDGDIRVSAPAKVNLYLHVTGRRPDGYHLLDSLIVFAGVGDTLAVSPGDDLDLFVDGPFADAVPTDEGNLVMQAAEILAERAKMAPRARIRLTKNLPVASGIGGGSADAAAALIALSRLWGLQPGADTLAALAIRLGADVPVCLTDRPSRIGGIGEIIEPAPRLPEAWLVLANAGVAVSTPTVFRGRSGAFSNPRPIAEPPAGAMDLAVQLAGRRNDLTAAARDLVPVIGDVIAALAATDGCLLSRMSGSGGTCFGLFAKEKAARAAAAGLSAAQPDWWVAAAPMLTADAKSDSI
jgi:4-diphosphocytidyl-2-C-methyl-D-erythritol kinase